jgi:sporulation protein YlmC with PRC-barrel domain
MRITYKDISGVPVETESGETLGKLVDLTLDIDTYAVTDLRVAKSSLLSKLLPSDLQIHVSQVVSISKEKIVVRDSTVEDAVAKSAVVAAERAAGAGVSHRVLESK